jgi:micrococcal nuclease
MYQYQAVINKVIDGDTIEVDIDLGISVWVRGERIRLYGINTPEVYGVKAGSPEWTEGKKASDFVKAALPEGERVIIETIKDQKEKYGRYLGIVYAKLEQRVPEGSNIRSIGDYLCLNDLLVAKGLANVYLP